MKKLKMPMKKKPAPGIFPRQAKKPMVKKAPIGRTGQMMKQMTDSDNDGY